MRGQYLKKENEELNKKMRENPLFGCLDQVVQIVNQDVYPRVKELNPIRSLK